MSLEKGPISFLRFYSAPPEPGFEVHACEALRELGFREIDPNSDETRRHGWVRFDDAFSSEFDPAALVDDAGYVLLRLRVDTLTVPKPTLRAYVAEATRLRLIELGRDKLTAEERKLLALEVEKRLRKRSLARIQLYEVAWNVATGEVRLMSTSNAVGNLLMDHFHRTFGVSLDWVDQHKLLWLRGVTEQEIEDLGRIEPVRLHALGI